jgi:chromosome partitioning protein
MKVVAFSSLKGGTGKSSLTVLCAKYCAAAGAKVLVIDLDFQNASSYHFSPDGSTFDAKNMALVFNTGKLPENIVPSNRSGIDLIAAHYGLCLIETVGGRVLKNAMAEAKLKYDVLLIDCPPHWTGIVRNADNVADLIINPVRITEWDYKGAVFYRDLVKKHTDGSRAWRVLLNFYRPPRTENPDAKSVQYEAAFREEFGDSLLPFTVPQTALVRDAIDSGTHITQAADKALLFNAIRDIAALAGIEGDVKGF